MPEASRYHASDGAAYEIFLGRWTRALADRLVDFADFPSGGALLDVGCGTGSLALAMRRRGPAAGIDIAPPYVAFAKTRSGPDGPLLTAGDAGHLPFADNAFAGAAAQLVLNFVGDPVAAVSEMGRVTRPGGVVAACVWDFRGGLVYQRLFWDTAAGIDPAAATTRDRLFSGALAVPGGLDALFQRARLPIAESVSLTVRMEYASFADYWAPLLGGQGPVGTYAAALRPQLRRPIEAAVRAAYLSGAPDGPRSMTASAWAVRAVVP
ncbi:MAG: methyltransferase domain-containing protein [Alphaproteobacteria bacterium]|nr:methyltransferase domain-containing protein [Alphaproteobacteria bacterium]